MLADLPVGRERFVGDLVSGDVVYVSGVLPSVPIPSPKPGFGDIKVDPFVVGPCSRVKDCLVKSFRQALKDHGEPVRVDHMSAYVDKESKLFETEPSALAGFVNESHRFLENVLLIVGSSTSRDEPATGTNVVEVTFGAVLDPFSGFVPLLGSLLGIFNSALDDVWNVDVTDTANDATPVPVVLDVSRGCPD